MVKGFVFVSRDEKLPQLMVKTHHRYIVAEKNQFQKKLPIDVWIL